MTEIPTHTIAASARAMKFQVLGLLNEILANSGEHPTTVALRLGWSTTKFMRIMEGRRKITLRDMAQIAWAIDGSVLKMKFEPRKGQE